jgi:hypothetical protein
MKLLVATVALATAFASPVFAQSSRHPNEPAAHQTFGQARQNQARPFVRQVPNARAYGAYGWQRGGETDPDPFIRDYLHNDPPGNYN